MVINTKYDIGQKVKCFEMMQCHKHAECDTCNGSGKIYIKPKTLDEAFAYSITQGMEEKKCSVCDGTGKVMRHNHEERVTFVGEIVSIQSFIYSDTTTIMYTVQRTSDWNVCVHEGRIIGVAS